MLKIIGLICLIVGIALLSPLDDIIILLIFGVQALAIVWAIGAVLTAIGIAILGTHILLSMGWIGIAIARHPAVLGVIIVATLGGIWWWSSYGG